MFSMIPKLYPGSTVTALSWRDQYAGRVRLAKASSGITHLADADSDALRARWRPTRMLSRHVIGDIIVQLQMSDTRISGQVSDSPVVYSVETHSSPHD